jgi:hypothetical protein
MRLAQRHAVTFLKRQVRVFLAWLDMVNLFGLDMESELLQAVLAKEMLVEEPCPELPPRSACIEGSLGSAAPIVLAVR